MQYCSLQAVWSCWLLPAVKTHRCRWYTEPHKRAESHQRLTASHRSTAHRVNLPLLQLAQAQHCANKRLQAGLAANNPV